MILTNPASSALQLMLLIVDDDIGLLDAMKRLRARGGVLRIVGPRPDVRRIFEITLLDRVFPLDATRSEALAAGATEDTRA